MVNLNKSKIQQANEKFRMGDFQAALNIYRELLKENALPRQVAEFNIQFCEKKLALTKKKAASTGTVAGAAIALKSDVTRHAPVEPVAPQLPGSTKPVQPIGSPDVTVTLTTIKSRLPKIGLVIESLHKQTVLPKKIVLNMSHEPYLLDEGIAEDDPHLTALREFPLVHIKWVDNIGPYRKIWPFLQEHFSNSITCDQFFITVDDDTIYPEFFVEKLLCEFNKYDCVIAFRGRKVESGETKLKEYKDWDIGHAEVRISNLPTGKDGVLYNTKFFTSEFLNLRDALELAPTADDLWIKWHCAMNGVPAVIINPEACTSDHKGFPAVDYSTDYREVSLYSMHNSAESKGNNDISVERLEHYFLEKFGYNLFRLMNI